MVWLSLHACENAHMYGVLVLGQPHPTLVHNGNGKLMSVDASSEPWEGAGGASLASANALELSKAHRQCVSCVLKGTWTNDELGGPSLLATTTPMAPSHRSRTGHEWCGCRCMHAKCTCASEEGGAFLFPRQSQSMSIKRLRRLARARTYPENCPLPTSQRIIVTPKSGSLQ